MKKKMEPVVFLCFISVLLVGGIVFFLDGEPPRKPTLVHPAPIPVRAAFREYDLILPGRINNDYCYLYDHGGIRLFTDIQRSGAVCMIKEPGASVRVIGQRDGHVKIRYQGKEGWLSESMAFNR